MSKGQFLYKISCPGGTHEDVNPSCGVYSDGNGYCFACNTTFRDVVKPDPTVIKYVENVPEKVKYIQSLPKQTIRGFELPFDSAGYYILWPSLDYYKLRRWDNNHSLGRYLSPSGVTKPWFVANQSKSKTLVLVEGEINAMSVAKVLPTTQVISPGSASNFSDAYSRNKLTELTGYSKVVLLVDADGPGFEAAIKVKQLIKHQVPDIVINTMKEDANSILVAYGETALRKEVAEVGMRGRVRRE
jgi:5S rRNA maturation endonuclease (ribonuclease M5)